MIYFHFCPSEAGTIKMSINYCDLRNHVISSYRTADGSRPEVLLVSYNEQKLVIKDYTSCPGLFGGFVGSYLIFREKKSAQ